ncbi:MAG: alpha/beta hydrolase [Pseudomonadota bacterium]|nr:alpha/beta hydrolase [Pseudomonadota bacterium]
MTRPLGARQRSTRIALLACTLASAAAGAQELSECRIPGLRNSVRCGVLVRPLDPARPQGPTLDIHVAIVPAMARRKLPDPVFLLAGGPGQSAIGVAAQVMPLFSRLNNRRDIVFVDQRGTGRSAPLDCADPKRESLDDQSGIDEQVQQAIACRDALVKLPYIPSASALGLFTTTIAVQDLDAVRRRLGAAQIDLVGVSYGTRVALEYMRQFPTAVRRAVLDSVAPADMALPASFSTDGQAALDAVFSACRSQPPCAAAYPDLHRDWEHLLSRLPLPAVSPHPLSGEPQQFTLTREMVLGAVRGALYNPAIAAALPAAIHRAAAGRYEGLIGIGSVLGSRRGLQLSMGMHYSVICAEDAPLLEPSTDSPAVVDVGSNPPGVDFGSTYAQLYRRVCAAWPRGPVPSAFYTIAPTRVATLLLSGGNDPATPPRHAARVARALGPAARHVVVPHAGHGVLAIGCGKELLYQFIDAGDDLAAAALDPACLTAVPRPTVFQPTQLTTQGVPE